MNNLDSKWAKGLVELHTKGFRMILGGGFQCHRFRELGDIDVLIHPIDYLRLEETHLGEYSPPDEGSFRRYLITQWEIPVEIFHDSYPPGFGYYDCIDLAVGLGGIPAWSIETTIIWKKLLNRPKDLIDIDLLVRCAG